MTIQQIRHSILRHIRNAFALGWSSRLGMAARAFAALLKARLVLMRAAA
jgi:hypothetical protein